MCTKYTAYIADWTLYLQINNGDVIMSQSGLALQQLDRKQIITWEVVGRAGGLSSPCEGMWWTVNVSVMVIGSWSDSGGGRGAEA